MRNLVEFAGRPPKRTQNVWFALGDIPGCSQRNIPDHVRTFFNNWFAHLGDIRTQDSTWPNDLHGNQINEHAKNGNEDFQRLTKLTEVVFRFLEPDDRTITASSPDLGEAYLEVLDRAQDYFTQRTSDTFDAMACCGVPMPTA